MSSPRAVLWDMDGTLIDSEEFHWISWRDTMAHEGIAISHEDFLASFGRRNDAILSQWLGAAVTPERIEGIGNAKEERYRGLVRTNGMPSLPGVAKWLQRLHEQRWRQAIASAAPRANVDAILKALGAADYFDAIVSAEDVHIGKPDPEVYLKAATRAGATPDRCIVVEDAEAGIEGARRGGMRTIGVGHNSQHLAADVMVRSLDLLDSNAFDRLVGRGSE